MDLAALIRTIPDYPKPGILFRDITTLLKDAAGFRHAVDAIVDRHRGRGISQVAGIEARGFILGGAVAHQLGAGIVPVRKRVKLHLDAVARGERVLLVDDLIATGGTAEAAVTLLRQAGAVVAEACFVID